MAVSVYGPTHSTSLRELNPRIVEEVFTWVTGEDKRSIIFLNKHWFSACKRARLREEVKSIQTIAEEWIRVERLKSYPEAFVVLGDIEEADVVLETLPDHLQTEIGDRIDASVFRQKDIEKIIRDVSSISNSKKGLKGFYLDHVVGRLLSEGAIDRAVAIFRDIEDDFWRLRVVEKLPMLPASLAQKFAVAMPDSHSEDRDLRNRTLESLVLKRAKEGKIDEALSLSREIHSRAWGSITSAGCLQYAVQVLLAEGNIENAIKIGSSISSTRNEKGSAFEQICSALMKRKDFDRAIELSPNIDNRLLRTAVLFQAGTGLAEKGQFDRAYDMVGLILEIPDPILDVADRLLKFIQEKEGIPSHPLLTV